MNLKQLWNKLALENSKYYINSDEGKGITESKFRESGLDDYLKYVLEDEYIAQDMESRTIVDLGCGIGRMTEYMADDFRRVIGVDISGEMIEQAKKRLFDCLNIMLYETDGETLPLEDNSVDVVFSYLVFQHIKDRGMVEKNFKEVYRVLRPDGIFKVRIRSDKVDLNKWWGGVEYTEQSIGELIKEVGFDLLKTEPVGDYGFWLWLKK